MVKSPCTCMNHMLHSNYSSQPHRTAIVLWLLGMNWLPINFIKENPITLHLKLRTKLKQICFLCHYKTQRVCERRCDHICLIQDYIPNLGLLVSGRQFYFFACLPRKCFTCGKRKHQQTSRCVCVFNQGRAFPQASQAIA